MDRPLGVPVKILPLETPAWAPCLIAFLGGMAALGHQMIWTRRMVDVLGATGDVFARVVGAFFVGLALGSAAAALFGARWLRSPKSAWLVLAAVEGGVGLASILPLRAPALLDGLAWPRGGAVGAWAASLALMGLPAFFMGFALPALAAGLRGWDARRRSSLARVYGWNTLGGVAGILATTLWGWPTLGLAGTGWMWIGLNGLCAAAALLTAFTGMPRRAEGEAEPVPAKTDSFSGWGGLALGFFSGFLVIALEVVLQQQFSQVAINSGFSSAGVLAVVLLFLGLAAFAAGLAKDGGSAWLRRALLAASFCLAAQPVVFHLMHPGLAIIPYELPTAQYFARFAGLAILVAGPAFFTLGLVFPCLLRQGAGAPGRVAALLAANGAGGWLGGEAAQGFLLPRWGLWLPMAALGALAGVGWLACSWRSNGFAGRAARAAAMASLIAWAGWRGGNLPQTARTPGEEVVEIQAGREGVVATVRHGDDWRIVFNNTYTLGGSKAKHNQERQGMLPALLHGRVERAALLGIATGSTLAGVGMDESIREIRAAELSPLALRYAREYFAPFNRSMLRSPRVEAVVADARMFVLDASAEFDLVVGDLFLPWRTGEGRLYSVEHFEAVRRSLRGGGVFCQWLPLFQLTRAQYDCIARTFLQVFPDAFLVRGDFYTEMPIVGLVGGWSPAGMDWGRLEENCRRLRDTAATTDPLLRHAQGVAMTLLGPLPDPGPGPVNTLDNAWLEFSAGWNIVGLREPWFIGVPAAEYFQARQRAGAGLLPAPLRAAHDSGQFFLTLEVAAKLRLPMLQNLAGQVLERLPSPLRGDLGADWGSWPMRVKPNQGEVRAIAPSPSSSMPPQLR